MAVLAAGTGTAAAIDIARRRVPNVLSLSLALTGIGLAIGGASGVTWRASLLGCLVGLALMLPGHLFGATGAGDVKLFAAAGAVLGVGRVLDAFVWMAIAGGLLALGIALQRGRLGKTLARTARLLGRSADARQDIESPTEHNRFPYAPAIAAGCVFAVLR